MTNQEKITELSQIRNKIIKDSRIKVSNDNLKMAISEYGKLPYGRVKTKKVLKKDK